MFEDKLAREATSSSRALPRLCIRKVEQSLSEPGRGSAQTEHGLAWLMQSRDSFLQLPLVAAGGGRPRGGIWLRE